MCVTCYKSDVSNCICFNLICSRYSQTLNCVESSLLLFFLLLLLHSEEFQWSRVRGGATAPPLPHPCPGGSSQSPAITGGSPGPLAGEIPRSLGDRVGRPPQNILLCHLQQPLSPAGLLSSLSLGQSECDRDSRSSHGSSSPPPLCLPHLHLPLWFIRWSIRQRQEHAGLSGVWQTCLVSSPLCQLPLPSVHPSRGCPWSLPVRH